MNSVQLHRRRKLTSLIHRCDVPPPERIKRAKSEPLLDTILRKRVETHAQSGVLEFGISAPYRGHTHATVTYSPTHKGTVGDADADTNARARTAHGDEGTDVDDSDVETGSSVSNASTRSTASVVWLKKSASAPVGSFSSASFAHESGLATTATGGSLDRYWPDSAGEDDAPLAQEWQCKGCQTREVANLHHSANSTMSCGRCGTVDLAVKMVSGTRQKNCAKEDDATITADQPDVDAHTARFLAWSSGPEESSHRRQRLLSSTGGTTLTQRAARQHGIRAASDIVARNTAKRLDNEMEGSGAEAKKRRALLKCMELIFDQIGNADHRLAKHLRIQGIRIADAACSHQRVCSEAKCQVSLAKRANFLVAGSLITHGLDQLCGLNPEDKPPELVEIGTPTLLTLLERAQAIQLEYSGATQRMQVVSTVAIVASWKRSQLCQPCGSLAPAAHTTLRMPPMLVNTSEGFLGKASVRDHTDKSFKLRDLVLSVASIANTAATVRDHSLAMLAVQDVETFLVASSLHVDVIACSMLLASASHCNASEPKVETIQKTTTSLHKCPDFAWQSLKTALVKLFASIPARNPLCAMRDSDLLF